MKVSFEKGTFQIKNSPFKYKLIKYSNFSFGDKAIIRSLQSNSRYYHMLFLTFQPVFHHLDVPKKGVEIRYCKNFCLMKFVFIFKKKLTG